MLSQEQPRVIIPPTTELNLNDLSRSVLCRRSDVGTDPSDAETCDLQYWIAAKSL